MERSVEIMLSDSKEDSEDEVFFGKVTARELNIVKDRFLSHRVPRQLEEPFQSYSDSELETHEKMDYLYPFTSCLREYECIDWHTDEEFRNKSKYLKYIPDDIIEFEHPRQTISNDDHKSSNQDTCDFQDKVFKGMRPDGDRASKLKSFETQSQRKKSQNYSLSNDSSTEIRQEKSSQPREKLKISEIKDGDDLNSSDNLEKCDNCVNNFVNSESSSVEVSKPGVSRKSKQLESSNDKKEPESVLATVMTSKKLVKDSSLNKSTKEILSKKTPEPRKKFAKSAPGFDDDITRFVLREDFIVRRNIQKTCIKVHVPKDSTPNRFLREGIGRDLHSPCVSSTRTFRNRNDRFSHIQSPVATYIRNQSSGTTIRHPAKRPRDGQCAPATPAAPVAPVAPACDDAAPKTPFSKIPKVNYNKVPGLFPATGKIVEKIPKRAHHSTPTVTKHTGRLLLVPVVKDIMDEMEPTEISILLKTSASFSDTIELEPANE